MRKPRFIYIFTVIIKVSAYLKVLHRSWLSRIYRMNLVKQPGMYERMKFKLAASDLFKGLSKKTRLLLFISSERTISFFI